MEKYIKYIKMMACLCEKNDVEFNIIIFPHAQSYAKLQGDLSKMDDFMEELCNEMNINLYNYNYTAYEGIYDIFTDDLYQEQKHLNKAGASRFAELLSQDYLERTGQ